MTHLQAEIDVEAITLEESKDSVPWIVNTKERLILLLSVAIASLFDWLMISSHTPLAISFFQSWGVFWICWLCTIYYLVWQRIHRNKLLWYIAGCAVLLCSWSFLFSAESEYCLLTFLVIPWVLMVHAQMAAGEYSLWDSGRIALAWFWGWINRPFSEIPSLFRLLSKIGSSEKRQTVLKVIVGVLVTAPLLGLILLLLSGADQVFGHMVASILQAFDLPSFLIHAAIISITAMLFFSFMQNIAKGTTVHINVSGEMTIDRIVSGILLGSVNLVYVIFCLVQFTYLFARLGLPEGMSYSSYAREGFTQTVTICVINLIIFGIMQRYGKGKATSLLLIGLLAMTAIMLFSGATRLWLYVDAYGLTWLRLISAWFIVYLAMVLVLCALSLRRLQIPTVAIAAIILLGWYVILGYSNPQAVIDRYNTLYHSEAGYEQQYGDISADSVVFGK